MDGGIAPGAEIAFRDRANALRAIRFERPDHIPMIFHVNAACWHHYDNAALQDLIGAHPMLFPDFERVAAVRPALAANQRSDSPYADPWGCVWRTTDDGIVGSVHEHPLAEWGNFDRLASPDPGTTDGTYPIDWKAAAAKVAADRARGRLTCGELPHGHTFLRLADIRGYESLLLDMADDEPRLPDLIDRVAGFNIEVVARWLELRPDMMRYPEDLGMQSGPMLTPAHFRRHILPAYRKIMQPARERGCIVHMHSDGDIRLLAGDLIGIGVDVLNIQDLVNGIDWIAENLAGRVCIDLDIDRQHITPGGTPQQIDALIREAVQKIGSKKGGLLMTYGLYPGVPLQNARAVMDAMETYAGWHA